MTNEIVRAIQDVNRSIKQMIRVQEQFAKDLHILVMSMKKTDVAFNQDPNNVEL